MPANRIRPILGIALLLFWAVMVSVAVQDYARDEDSAYWKLVLWETSSFIAFKLLLRLQYHVMRPYDHLIAQPRRCWGKPTSTNRGPGRSFTRRPN